MSDKIITIPVSNPIAPDDLAQSYTQEGRLGAVAFRAPIEMQPGDICTVNFADGTLYEIVRHGVAIWRKTAVIDTASKNH